MKSLSLKKSLCEWWKLFTVHSIKSDPVNGSTLASVHWLNARSVNYLFFCNASMKFLSYYNTNFFNRIQQWDYAIWWVFSLFTLRIVDDVNLFLSKLDFFIHCKFIEKKKVFHLINSNSSSFHSISKIKWEQLQK